MLQYMKRLGWLELYKKTCNNEKEDRDDSTWKERKRLWYRFENMMAIEGLGSKQWGTHRWARSKEWKAETACLWLCSHVFKSPPLLTRLVHVLSLAHVPRQAERGRGGAEERRCVCVCVWECVWHTQTGRNWKIEMEWLSASWCCTSH